MTHPSNQMAGRNTRTYSALSAELPLSAAMTELECARRVGREMARLGEETRGGVFRRLTAGWIRTAYAHETLAEARFLELVRDWREVFG